MIHLHSSFGPKHKIFTVSSTELNDQELLDLVIRLGPPINFSFNRQEIEVVRENGSRQNLEVFDLGINIVRVLLFSKKLEKHFPDQTSSFEYNDRWHSQDTFAQAASLENWPGWLQAIFQNLLEAMQEKYVSGTLLPGSVSKACELVDMAFSWSQACLEDVIALLIGAVLPRKSFEIGTIYFSKVGVDLDSNSRFVRLAQHASRRAAEWPLHANIFCWHASLKAMISKGWHRQLESLSEIGDELGALRAFGNRRRSEATQNLSWLLDPERDRLLEYLTEPEIEMDEFMDLARQEEPSGFRLMRILSQGSAFKIAYLAKDQTGRFVVLKRYKSWQAQPVKRRMERLATNPEKMISKDTVTDWLGVIRHSNIQPCMLVTNASGIPFILEPLLQSTLEEYATKSDPDATELLILLRGVVDAVAYLHARGLVHTDIKPDNIGIVGSLAILLDFGIATFDPQVARGNPGSIKTRAPELFSQDAIPTKASDIWALGATLMCVITGGEYPLLSREEIGVIAEMAKDQRTVFENSLRQRVQTYKNDPSRLQARLSTMLHGFPDSIRMIVFSACDVSPAERPSARELLEIFDAAIEALG
jgi:tRNA A-37 threonylcarbamoyl transferase component Bud32